MNFDSAQMLATLGGKLFYGGIAGMALAVLLILIFIPAFSAAKKKMIKKINSEFDSSDK